MKDEYTLYHLNNLGHFLRTYIDGLVNHAKQPPGSIIGISRRGVGIPLYVVH